MISDKALQDDQAVSVAEALAAANEVAGNAGVLGRKVRVLIEEKAAEDGTALWRIAYLPVPPSGVYARGGDYLVEVRAGDGTIYRTSQGQ